jgi:maleylacetoacetate isomerase
MADDLVLYGYFRSSAAFRVRIALNLKRLDAEHNFVHLLKDGGQQFGAEYERLNPQHLVPTLVHNGYPLQQSLAIIEYLDEVFPDPPLLPGDPLARARVRAIACTVACDIHPLNNLRMRKYLHRQLGRGDDEIRDWQVHWITLGFQAIETMLAGSEYTGRFCHGDGPTIADICLIPQMANAHALNMDLSPYPTLLRIEQAAYELPAFINAAPKNQPDAE